MKNFLLLSLVICVLSCNKTDKKSSRDFTTTFEKSNGLETPVYKEVISYYKDLANTYSEISLLELGTTDSGNPLHLVVYNTEGKTQKEQLKNSKKNRILINNGIHPGESDGIDASMLLLRDIVQNDSLQKAYQNSLICVIPIYNIGGALNRNSHTRANQNGPKEYGFRGNSRNFDLNRDFVKQDTKNAATFAQIFHAVNPDVFVDNHVSNGADYQYAITHLFTQHNKLGGELGKYLEQEMRPFLEKSLANKGIPITPYVNVWGSTPEKGWSQFMDSPRYSTGYTTLFNTFGMMVETHMLKPYKIRVEQTYELMKSMFDFTEKNSSKIKSLRAKAVETIIAKNSYPIQYKIDFENPTEFMFKGYEGTYIDSKVTNGKRLFYDKNKPFEKPVKYYNNFNTTKTVTVPKAYIIPQGWHNVISRLQNNNIEFSRFKNDTILHVEVNHIKDFKTVSSPFEGHYLHYNTEVNSSLENIKFQKGDYLIPINQDGIRYLLETLEAEAVDSFFNWNFFDTILQRKEGFSSYVFEDKAEDFLNKNPLIKAEFDNKMKIDTTFNKSARAQLNWIYTKTQHYEKAHLRLPVFKIVK
ncbi:M14 family metallopeptidase [uncultured Tenacibaculum sp.]|uniref:M14 family metallopeptidase n=1 Tax=uncultured Tenacibaculum sp. TaxID=174713 RepID=UPI00260CE966|nr:M14 family metallopeptidase [uncultured Tenacibaculum sp.]